MGSTEGISHTGFHAGSSPVKYDTRAAAQVARRQVRTMSATLYPTLPHPEPAAFPAARLALSASRGLLDGAWWPRPRDPRPPLTASDHIAADAARHAVSPCAPQPRPAPWVGIRASDRPSGHPAPPPARPAATLARDVDAGFEAPEDPSIRTEAS